MHIFALAFLVGLVAIAPLALAADQEVLLDVSVNKHAIGKIGAFVLRDGALLSRRQELTDLGIRVPLAATGGPDDLIALSTLPGLAVAFDFAAQTVDLTAKDQSLLPSVLRSDALGANKGPVESGTGATFDYDIIGTSAGTQRTGTGAFDFRAFSPWGVASTGALAYAGGGPAGPGSTSAIRLDSTYSLSDADTLRHYKLGDFINGGLSWSRSVRMGGAQVSLDFGIRPDLVTFPLPTINGSAAVPSTLDVLVNGNRLLNQQVEAGPFQVPQIPIVTGAGTVSMTLTNALGRQVTTTLPFYASSSLLAAGLQSYSLQAGSLRRNWGLVSNSYGNTVASASYRRGISSSVTIEGTAEVAAGVQMSGGGVAVNLDNIAILNADVAASTGPGRSGTMLNIGLSRVGQVFSAGAFATLTNGNFGDLASIYGDLVPKLQMNANAGLSMGRFGSVGIAYSSVDRNGVSTPSRFYLPAGTLLNELTSPDGRLVSFTPAQHAHVLSVSYSVQFGRVSWYATGYRDFASQGATGAMIGMTVPLGNNASMSTGVGTGSSGSFEQAQVSKPALLVGDVGYQALVSHADPDHQFAQLQYKAPFALLTAGADRIGTQNAYRGEAQGSVSLADGALFASNFINDSFAVVDTNGLPNVRVQLENREIGRTDSAGKLLVPDLRSFDINHLTVEPTDIPADASLTSASQNVRPQDRSGVVVRFPIRISHAALLHLVDEAGIALPVGSAATLRATGSMEPVGYDGQTYVSDLEAHNDLAVVTPNGRRCNVAFDYRPVPGDIPVIGPLRCAGEAP